MNHIVMGPRGVVTSMHNSRVPPTRRSIVATGTVLPSGPYQAAKCSGWVHSFQIVSGGAGKVRSIVTLSEAVSSVMFADRPCLVASVSSWR